MIFSYIFTGVLIVGLITFTAFQILNIVRAVRDIKSRKKAEKDSDQKR